MADKKVVVDNEVIEDVENSVDNVDNSLAQDALSDDDTPKEEVVVTRFVCSDMLYPVKRGIPLSPVIKSVAFPLSRTDQIHNVSVSEMVRRGTGQVKETEVSNFDFPDGKDDGTLEPVGLQSFDWADPAERFEKEMSLRAAMSPFVRQKSSTSSSQNKVDTGSSSDSSAGSQTSNSSSETE